MDREVKARHPISIRRASPEDHPEILACVKAWWGGRELTWMLPRLFLIHFSTTSFIAETNDALVGFLIGFLSQSNPNEGYVHLAGVHPDYRRLGLGRRLYDRFCRACAATGRDTVRACTSPVNRDSVAFHSRLGFLILPGDGEIDGIPVTRDYNRPGDPKVLFEKKLGQGVTTQPLPSSGGRREHG